MRLAVAEHQKSAFSQLSRRGRSLRAASDGMLLSVSTNGRSRPPRMHPLDNELLNAARALHRDGHAGAAVVTAHAAMEVVSEYVLPAFFGLRGVPELEGSRPASCPAISLVR